MVRGGARSVGIDGYTCCTFAFACPNYSGRAVRGFVDGTKEFASFCVTIHVVHVDASISFSRRLGEWLRFISFLPVVRRTLLAVNRHRLKPTIRVACKSER